MYVGINLNGWLPTSKSQATIENVKAHADFLVESPAGSIQGGTKGGFLLSFTSTANPGHTPPDNTGWDIPCMSVIDLTGP